MTVLRATGWGSCKVLRERQHIVGFGLTVKFFDFNKCTEYLRLYPANKYEQQQVSCCDFFFSSMASTYTAASNGDIYAQCLSDVLHCWTHTHGQLI